MMDLPLWFKIGAPILLLLLVGGLARWGLHWRDKAHAYNLEVSRILDATRIAIGNPKLERADLATQIITFGTSFDALEGGLDQCKASIDKLVQDSAVRQRVADAALSSALSRKAAAERSKLALEASARQPSNGQCLSREIRKRWK